jgi:hypothetical protein
MWMGLRELTQNREPPPPPGQHQGQAVSTLRAAEVVWDKWLLEPLKVHPWQGQSHTGKCYCQRSSLAWETAKKEHSPSLLSAPTGRRVDQAGRGRIASPGGNVIVTKSWGQHYFYTHTHTHTHTPAHASFSRRPTFDVLILSWRWCWECLRPIYIFDYVSYLWKYSGDTQFACLFAVMFCIMVLRSIAGHKYKAVPWDYIT